VLWWQWGQDGRPHDGSDDGLKWNESVLLQVNSRAVKATPIHDGTIHGHATKYDESNDATKLYMDGSAQKVNSGRLGSCTYREMIA